MDFLQSPLTYTRDQRTSRDVCRDACAIEHFQAPNSAWAPFWISLVIGFIAALAACYFT